MFAEIKKYLALFLLLSTMMMSSTGLTGVIYMIQGDLFQRYSGKTQYLELVAQMIIAMPTLSCCITSILLSIYGNNLNKWKLAVYGGVLFCLFGAIPALTDNMVLIFISRLIVGVFNAFIIYGTIGMMYIVVKNRVLFFSIQGAFLSLSAIIFVLLAMKLSMYYKDWHMAFVSFPIISILIVPFLLVFRNRKLYAIADQNAINKDVLMSKKNYNAWLLMLMVIYLILQVICDGIFKLNLGYFLAKKQLLQSTAFMTTMGVYSVTSMSGILSPIILRFTSLFTIILLSTISEIAGFYLMSRAETLTGICVATAFIGLSWGWFSTNSTLFLNMFTKNHNVGINLQTFALYLGFFVSPFIIANAQHYKFTINQVYSFCGTALSCCFILLTVYKILIFDNKKR